MQLRHVTASFVALAAIAVPVAGCGGSSSGSTAAHSGNSTQHTKANAPAKSKPSGGSGSVTISNFKFSPASLTLHPGTRITVANHDSTAHTATADKGQSFDTGNIDPGASATFSLSKPGTYTYHCTIHPFMHGTLVVR